MKTSKFTDSQIISILKQAESGTPVTTLCREHDIRIAYIQPGKPQQNAYIERYNRTIRYNWLSKHLFDTLEEVQDYATSWLWHYNHERPHQANKGRPPLMAA